MRSPTAALEFLHQHVGHEPRSGLTLDFPIARMMFQQELNSRPEREKPAVLSPRSSS